MEQVQLTFSAVDLPNVTALGLGQTDPFLVLHLLGVDGRSQEVGVSEVIMNSTDPHWATHFTLQYTFEVAQCVRVECYHKHATTATTGVRTKHQYMGAVQFNLSEVMTTTGAEFKRNFSRGMPEAKLIVRGEAVASTRDVFIGKFQCTGLNRMNGLGIFGKSDPFLVVSKMFENGTYGVAYKTMHISSELNPRFPECRVPLVPLCNGDIDRPLKIEVFDHESSGEHKFMGEVNTTLRLLMQNGATTGFDILEPMKKTKSGYTNSGKLKCIDARLEHHPSFTEYLRGGLEMSLMIAIDFTASNGDPRDRRSLHHLDPARQFMNPYQAAIVNVGKVLEPYDHDNKIPVWGFGARIRAADGSYTPVQHCFTVAEEAAGYMGVLGVYEDVMKHVGLSGPTLFGNIIDTAGVIAASTGCAQAAQKYNILLIITDGIINDMEATKAAIAMASGQPLSIIIVGVGSEDFSSMKALDSDGKLLSTASGKHKSERDIVQFVAMRDFAGKPETALAAEVLAEVPTQVLQFMAKRGIMPNKAPVIP